MITEYQKTLFLSYVKESKEVDFNDLNLLLGLNNNNLDKLLSEMMDSNYIAYVNYKLQLTEQGIRHLIAIDQINSSFEDSSYVLRNISPDKSLAIDEPFIPKNFASKI